MLITKDAHKNKNLSASWGELVKMRLSVFTVCFNSAKTIDHTIQSFLGQDHEDKELVVVDGSSTDRTVEIVRSYSADNIHVVSEPDEGMYDALNKALRIYTGDAFGVLNSDDAYHDQTTLSRVADALERTDAVHGHLNFVECQSSKKIVRRWRGEPMPSKGFRTGWMPAHPTFYARREVADSVGEFDLSWGIAADYDWMLRALECEQFGLELIDHVMVDMAQGGKSTRGVGAYVNHNLEALKSRQKWLGAGLVDYALIAKPARKLRQFL